MFTNEKASFTQNLHSESPKYKLAPLACRGTTAGVKKDPNNLIQ